MDDPTIVLTNPTPPPMPAPPPGGKRVAFEYLTVRELFAAHALQGVIAAHAGDGISLPEAKKAARWAREYADALLVDLVETAAG